MTGDREAPLFRIDGEAATLSEVMEFLGSIPSLQHLPLEIIKRIAQAVQPRQYEPCELIELCNGKFIIWRGALVTRKSKTLLKPGDYGALEELRGAFAKDKLTLLILSSKDAELIYTQRIWDSPTAISFVERIMQLEKTEVDVFRGFSLPSLVTFGQMFGGQLVGQALAAASKSVNPFLLVHSLHSYFLRPGDTAIPVTYRVQRYQDGRNFANRFVSAVQNDQIIFTMSASFQREEDGLEHQFPMPSAPQPEEVLPEEVVSQSYVFDSRLSHFEREMLKVNVSKDRPLDVRCCDPLDQIEPEVCDSRDKIWFRAKGKLSDDQALHRCVAAYATDWIFLECALRPHGFTSGPDGVFNVSKSSNMKMLSLDHSLWFHKSIKADEWHLFSMESPCAASARAFVTGHLYSQNGTLVISATQEGLIRKRRNNAQSKL